MVDPPLRGVKQPPMLPHTPLKCRAIRMTEESDVSYVINRTATLENIMNQIIYAYCQPSKNADNFFWDVILDSSIMSLGAKVKAVCAIAFQSSFKMDSAVFHKAISLRNAFAHHSVDAHQMYIAGREKGTGESISMLQVLKSNGNLELMERRSARARFELEYTNARAILVKLMTHISRDSN